MDYASLFMLLFVLSWIIGSLLGAGIGYYRLGPLRSVLQGLFGSWYTVGLIVGNHFSRERMVSDGRGPLKFKTDPILSMDINIGDLLKVSTKEEVFWVKVVQVIDSNNVVGSILTDLASTEYHGYRKDEELTILRKQIFEHIPRP